MGGHSVGYYQVVAQPDDDLAEVEDVDDDGVAVADDQVEEVDDDGVAVVSQS